MEREPRYFEYGEVEVAYLAARDPRLGEAMTVVHCGLRMVHHHHCRITPELLAKYRRRYTTYGSVASLYLWEVAGGAMPGMKDWAPKSGKR